MLFTRSHVLEKQSLVCELCFLQRVMYLRSVSGMQVTLFTGSHILEKLSLVCKLHFFTGSQLLDSPFSFKYFPSR